MRDKYGTESDPYCYPDSDTLINLFDIHDPNTLSEAETDFYAQRLLAYQATDPSLSHFTLNHLQTIHHHLFQDVYNWAGEIRSIDVSKGRTRFCAASRIVQQSSKEFSLIPQLSEISDLTILIAAFADIYCELNIIHPFREGNGRTLRLFFEELAFVLGQELVWPNIDKEQWVQANIAGYNGDLQLLIEIFTIAFNAENHEI
ncbi:Fic family protein [Shewanella eurypsychrophilus]|uniref:protein adenylyltransferase n=1 Tax=Shewanella eurypsychrophilus TaxID=2593656 RepID=A0ABX6VD42_9GAMM|nr:MULTISPECIES: Fic family protein [Shewanella]QFU24267.1 cell filamentation protein Fic [Shewanella sp. YLB-09]QPG59470.1 Fic family protein [Shewanella eurypsychrophilus]